MNFKKPLPVKRLTHIPKPAPSDTEDLDKIASTLGERLDMKVVDGTICVRLSLKDLCGEATDLFDAGDAVPGDKNKVN